MDRAPTPQERESFYTAGILGLRSLDVRESSPRRFGEAADRHWAGLAGGLGLSDRIDILLRDASQNWGTAFSPSACFDFFGLADDEPFGPDWQSLAEGTAKRLISEPLQVPTIKDVAGTLGITISPVQIPELGPSSKIVVAGGAALAEVAQRFAKDGALSWSDQVLAVASAPATRQLAGLAAVLLGAARCTTVLRPNSAEEASLRAAGFAHLDYAIVSDDAEPDAAEFAITIGGK